MNKRLFILLIVGLFCLSNATRWAYRSRLGHTRFVAEGAAHLRYTEMVANGQAVPAIDRKAQWPEGLAVYRDTSIAMEYLYGMVYRLIPGSNVDIVRFIRFFTAFLFSLAVFPVASLSAALWRSRRAGVLSAALFAVSLPLVARSSGFEFVRENVTFPLLIYHIHFLMSACSSARWRDACLSGLFCALALSSWQGTQFYLVPLLFFLLVRRLAGPIGAGERRSVWMLALFSLGAGAAVPFLRQGGFLLSIPVGLSAAWAAADLVSTLRRAGDRSVGDSMKQRSDDKTADRGVRDSMKRRSGGGLRVARTAAAAAALACILLPALLSKEHFASYSHFFKLVLYKLRYVYKPEDPRLLPFVVRAFWVGPFHSPDPLHFFVFALPLVLVLPGPIDRLIRRTKAGEFQALFVLTFCAVFLVLFLLMQRLLPLFGFFAILAGGGNAVLTGSTGRERAVLRPGVFVAFVVLGISLLQDFAWEGPGDIWRRAARALKIPHREKFVVYPYARDVEGALLSWIRNNTGEDSVILSLHYLSPQVLTYTDRPTNLNDFFESVRLRRKAERFLTELYASEKRLFAFCREQSSDYLLVSAAVGCDPTSDSPLYQAGQTGMQPGSAAYLLMFEPQRLTLFDLVYENEMYRVFKVGRAASGRRWPRAPLFYESELLWRHDGDIRTFYNTVMHIYAVTALARSLLASGSEREAEETLARALRVYYFYPAWRLLAYLYGRSGRLEELAALSELAYGYDPHRPDVCIELARSKLETGEVERAREVLTRCRILVASERQRAEMERLLRLLDSPSR